MYKYILYELDFICFSISLKVLLNANINYAPVPVGLEIEMKNV